MRYWSFAPVWVFDFVGSAVMILITSICFYLVLLIYRRDPESPMATYLLWFTGALFAFSLSRSLGHMVKYILDFTGHLKAWDRIAPISGSINSITFVVIASVTLFFDRMQAIMLRMNRYRDKIEKTSQEVLELNRDLEKIVFERTRAEMALRIAHEVRNPVMIIGGLVQRMIDSCPLEAEKNKMRKIVEQSQNLESLVARFEQLSRKNERIFTTLELNALVEESLDIVKPEAEQKEITVILDRSPAALLFKGNAQLLKTAMIHVLRNAIDACASGNTVYVSTGVTTKGIELLIKDDGPGIPPDIIDHIFEPFYMTTKGGTGLGLPYVKQIVEEHRGAVSLESNEHEGTAVTITLPTHLAELLETRDDFQI